MGTIQFYGGKLRKETSLSVESDDGIVPSHLDHNKKSTPLKVFKMGWAEILKTLPQQLASHKKRNCYPLNQNKMRSL